MEVAGTISSYLESEKKFDHLFWTSFSMDPITIEFLFKNDLEYCLNKPYFHFICDKNKIDETIEKSLGDPKKIYRLSQMQNYLSLSHERVEGAFHPKILFFSSKDGVKCVVLSGNATSSGILSNQDLVAKFEWSASGTTEFQEELASIYQFLRSFDGWNRESKSELDSIAETHPWLLELRSERVYFSDGNTPLLDQFVNKLPFDWDIEQILIFSPFTDPELRALTEIAKIFPSTRIIWFYPGELVEVNNPNKVLPENLLIQSSGVLNKTRFHAKYFAFLGNKKAYALWGSANCSYSALLSPNRNKEILIGYDLEPETFFDLWPGSGAKSDTSIELIKITEKESEKQTIDIELLSGRVEENHVELVTSEDFRNKNLTLILFDAEEISAGQVSSNKCKVKIPLSNTHKICGAYLCDASGKRISNALFLNNFLKIQKSVTGAQETPSYDRLKEDKRKLVSRLGTEFFVVDREKTRAGSTGREAQTSAAYGFWHMPQYRRRQSTVGIFGHERFIRNYVSRHKARKDPDGDENGGSNETTTSHNHLTKDLSALRALSKQSRRVLDVLVACSKNDKLERKIPFDRWLKGEDYMLRYLLETIFEYEVFEERELTEIKSFLKNFVRIVFHTLEKLKISEYENGMDFVRSLNMTCSLYLLLAKYSWSKMSFERGTLSTIKGFEQNSKELADAGFMKILAERCLDEHGLNRAYEAKTLLLEHVSSCLHHASAANEALAFTAPGLRHVDEPVFDPNDIVILNDNVLIFKRMKDRTILEFTNMLGTNRPFLAEHVKPRRIYSFMESINL